MSTRALLGIVLGLAVSVVAVGGLAWAGAADSSLELSSQARDADGTGLDPATMLRLRTPEPAPAPVAEHDAGWESAAPTAAEQPGAWDEDDDDEAEDDDESRRRIPLPRACGRGETADAPGLGPGGGDPVEVRVLPPASALAFGGGTCSIDSAALGHSGPADGEGMAMAADEAAADPAKADEERRQRTIDRTEIAIAILLGIAAILTAWATFQSSQLGAAVTAAYSEGIRLSDTASQAFNDASATDIADEALFLEFAKAANAGDEGTADYIYSSLMSEDLAAAVDWWSDQPDSAGYDTPFVEDNPNWSTVAYDDAAAIDADAQAKFEEATAKDALGTDFDVLSIIIAISLFLFGVGSLVRQERIKIGLGAVGAVILVYSAVRLVQLGNPAGVSLGTLF